MCKAVECKKQTTDPPRSRSHCGPCMPELASATVGNIKPSRALCLLSRFGQHARNAERSTVTRATNLACKGTKMKTSLHTCRQLSVFFSIEQILSPTAGSPSCWRSTAIAGLEPRSTTADMMMSPHVMMMSSAPDTWSLISLGQAVEARMRRAVESTCCQGYQDADNA
jgi:hypothetical protein